MRFGTTNEFSFLESLAKIAGLFVFDGSMYAVGPNAIMCCDVVI
jgi:hypothetical protein